MSTKCQLKNVFKLLLIALLLLPLIYFFATFVIPKISCVLTGDKIVRVGLSREYRCVHTFSDGGRTCSSSTDCEGVCLADTKGLLGTCSLNNSPYGCFAKVEDCKIVNGEKECQTLCVD